MLGEESILTVEDTGSGSLEVPAEIWRWFLFLTLGALMIEALLVLPGRKKTETAYAGDIIGVHNHGTINIGDSFSEGEIINFSGIPNFAPEIFRRVILNDPLKLKALF